MVAFSAIYGNNIHDLLYASLDYLALPKSSQSFMENAPREKQIFFQ